MQTKGLELSKQYTIYAISINFHLFNMSSSKVHKFDAEVGKVLQLMIHSLYTNKEIFLRGIDI